MSAFFDRFEELCRARGETPNSVAKKLGIPSGSIPATGTNPGALEIQGFRDFFLQPQGIAGLSFVVLYAFILSAKTFRLQILQMKLQMKTRPHF